MSKKGSKAPAAPDPYQTASAESQFNRLDTFSPSGTGQAYGYTNAAGQFVRGTPPKGSQAAVSTIESPWEKSIREMLQPASTNLVGKIIKDNVTNLPGPAQAKNTDALAKTIFDRNFSMMKPAIDRGQTRLLTNLQSRGLPVGGAAFNEAQTAQQRETEDMISRLSQDATINAGNEQSRQFGIDSAARQNSLSEIIAAMTGTYSPPSSSPSGSAAGVNYAGLVGDKFNADTAAYQEKQKQKTSTMGTIGSLAAGLMKCTMEAKDIEGGMSIDVAAQAVSSMPLAVWRYKPGMAPEGRASELHVGPMAEHFAYLTGLGDGRNIDPIDAFGVLFGALQSALHRIEVLERQVNREGVH